MSIIDKINEIRDQFNGALDELAAEAGAGESGEYEGEEPQEQEGMESRGVKSVDGSAQGGMGEEGMSPMDKFMNPKLKRRMGA